MSEDKWAAIEARHQPFQAFGGPLCRECTDDRDVCFPCDAATLVAEVKRLRAMLDPLRTARLLGDDE